MKMKYDIRKIENRNVDKDQMQGYSFRDECGHCIIIVYGENRRDAMIKHLEGDSNELHIKYHYIDLNKK